MYPFSYTGLKMIHDQMIQQALERSLPYAGQGTQKQDLLQALGNLLARFNSHPDRKQEEACPVEPT